MVKPRKTKRTKPIKKTTTPKTSALNRLTLLAFEQDLKLKFGTFEKEAVLIPNRRFRCDYWIPQMNLAIEVNGGQFSNGRHTGNRKVKKESPETQYEKDLEKMNLLACLRISVIQFTYQQIRRGDHLKIFGLIKL
jgi:hypothetical protein